VPQRRVNDAQVERLLAAMRDVRYRQALARKILEREGVKQFTPTGKVRAEWKRRYNSVMRRFQRYVTESGERRSFARAPVQYQRQTRAVARSLPPPRPLPVPKPPPRVREPELFEEEEYEEEEEEEETGRADFYSPESNTILRSVVAYYDGDIDEAAQAMKLSARGTRLLELATTGEGVQIRGMRGSDEVYGGVSELLYGLPAADVDDIQEFHDLLMDLPDWQIGIMLADLEDGDTTFSDWLEAWQEGDEGELEDAAYWALWRAAYARQK